MPLGFDPAGLLVVTVEPGADEASARQQFARADAIEALVAGVPGVSRASASFLTPLGGRNWTHRVQVTDGPTQPRGEQTAWFNAVAPGWFATYDMRLRAGRDIAA